MSSHPPLVGYQLNAPASVAALSQRGALYNYALAGNGVFIAAERPGLQVRLQISHCEVRGLDPLESFAELQWPKLPSGYLRKMLELSHEACLEKGVPTEALFHLIYLEADDKWRLDMPEQVATAESVRPTEGGEGSSYDLAIIEVHSHHQMDAFFSTTDDADEQGFRIYGVIGNIFSEPKLRVRVGVYGHFWELPAESIFEMPEGIVDARDCDES